jgi:outer membrane protein, heavy metal efflux system
MNLHYLRISFLAVLLSLLASPVMGEEDAAVKSSGPLGADVMGLLNWADEHNPELAAIQHEADAMEARIAPADALDDPVFRMELQGIDRNNPTLAPNGVESTKYTLLQSFPVWGKLDLRRDVAQAEASQAKARSAIARAELHAQIKTAFAMFYQALRSTYITREIVQLMSNLEKITQARYINGIAPQQDLIRVQTERNNLRAELLTLESELHHSRTRLNYALNRESFAALVEPVELRPLPALLDGPALEQRLLASSPFLSSQTALIDAAEKKRQLIEKDNYPDLTLGISPIQRGNSVDSWDAMLEIKIPLQQGSRRGREQEAGSLLAAAQQRRQALHNQVLGGFRESFDALGNARNQISLLKNSLVPQAELTFESAMIGYEAGKVDFTTLLEAQLQVKKVKVNLLKAQVEQDNRLTEIERLLGEEL